MAGGVREPGRDVVPVLASRRLADPDPDPARDDDPALRQRVRRPGHRLPADRRHDQPGDPGDQLRDARGRAQRSGARLRPGDGHGRDHGCRDRPLFDPAAPFGPLVPMKPSKIASWVIFILGFLYFFVPLLATLVFSINTNPPGRAYSNMFADPQFFASLSFSAIIGILTMIFSILIIVPTAFWVRLRLPQLRPLIEFVTLLPFVIPPVILVFGLIHAYGGSTLIPLANSDFGDNILAVSYTH